MRTIERYERLDSGAHTERVVRGQEDEFKMSDYHTEAQFGEIENELEMMTGSPDGSGSREHKVAKLTKIKSVKV